jgi:hypothetical protein
MATAAGADIDDGENLQQQVQDDPGTINIAAGLDSSAGLGRQLLEPNTPSSVVEPPRCACDLTPSCHRGHNTCD